MTKGSRLGSFDDIKAILDVAVATGGGKVELASYAEALKWRTRAYRFRKLYAERVPHSPYDRLSFPQPAKGQNYVMIETHAQAVNFVPAVQAPTTSIVPDDDPALAYALKLAKSVDTGDINLDTDL